MPGTRDVYVTAHAARRAADRFPDWVPDARYVDSIFYEVSAALEAGRKSKTVPRWVMTANDSRARGKASHSNRFVWNEEETRCYPVSPSQAPNGRRKWIVLTTLQRRAEEAA